MVEPPLQQAAEPIEELALRLDRERAPGLRKRLARLFGSAGAHLGHAVVLAAAYPALLPLLEARPDLLDDDPPGREPDRPGVLALAAHEGDLDARGEAVRRELRRLARGGRLRIALRELLPTELGGLDPVAAMAEISALAERTIELALDEAQAYVFSSHGAPVRPDGQPGALVVLGMGKLGGCELNPGSDVDLICLYDTDDARAVGPGGATCAPAELWAKVVQRMVSNLEEATADGAAWRVDLRLRPDGRHGPVVLSLAATERYYESLGRLWERAALLRARPVAGRRSLGDEALVALEPFVWRRRVDPSIAGPLLELAARARAELSRTPGRDLKLGAGGIRDVELFTQILQLIWGGKDRSLRVRSTLDAVDRLRTAGLVTERDANEATAAYLLLRRAEHAVQHATGLQTHALPKAPDDLARLARAVGHPDGPSLLGALDRGRTEVRRLVGTLLPSDAATPSRWAGAVDAAERQDWTAFDAELRRLGLAEEAEASPSDITKALLELGRHPDAPLGARALESYRWLADGLLDAVADAADPRQAAHYLRRFQSRVRHPAITTSQLAADPAAVRRLVQVLGSSAFVGEIVASRPDLGDLVLFGRELPSSDGARAEVKLALEQALDQTDDVVESATAALRRAKLRVTTEVALADLGESLTTAECGEILSALADAVLAAALDVAARVAPGQAVGSMAVLAMGSLGARQIGYGSDLDVLFLFEPAGPMDEALSQATRLARLLMRILTSPHAAGPGYELDAQLRPSGRQGLLVVSLESFARYHGVSLVASEARTAPTPSTEPATAPQGSAIWERLALLRARFCAGGARLGAAAMQVAQEAAYTRPTEPRLAAAEVDRLRGRILRELARERHGRYDVKFGRGALAELELTVQLLQLLHGRDERVRLAGTRPAIAALAAMGMLDTEQAACLEEGHDFLRRLEQRMRVVHGDDSHLLQEGAPGLGALARRMGIREVASREAGARLMHRYRETTERVHRCYEQIVLRLASGAARSDG